VDTENVGVDFQRLVAEVIGKARKTWLRFSAKVPGTLQKHM